MEGREIIKWIFTGILTAAIVGYSVFILYDYFRGPRIIITNPESGFSTTTPVIAVAGRAFHINTLSVNGADVPADLDGNFQNQLILAPGYNIMKATGKDRYGRVAEEHIEITLLATSTIETKK
ncbi:MAG: hypothetical protein HZB12_00905 [Candidatus Yonathbacteria bacterium]|nr:hypothetical protein [Candidatus Yonathbacteria bacterium]